MLKTLYSLLVLLLACNSFKKNNSYYYKLDRVIYNRTLNTSSTEVRNIFISYKEWLFEFDLIFNFNTDLNNKDSSEVLSNNADTAGIYVMKLNSKYFYKFNSFSDTAHVILKDSLIKKKTGIAVLDDKNMEIRALEKNIFTDTSINNLNYKKTSNSNKLPDSLGNLKVVYYFIEKSDLLTPFNINGLVKNLNDRLAFAGVGFYEMKSNYISRQIISNLRELSTTEKLICEKLIKKIN